MYLSVKQQALDDVNNENKILPLNMTKDNKKGLYKNKNKTSTSGEHDC